MAAIRKAASDIGTRFVLFGVEFIIVKPDRTGRDVQCVEHKDKVFYRGESLDSGALYHARKTHGSRKAQASKVSVEGMVAAASSVADNETARSRVLRKARGAA